MMMYYIIVNKEKVGPLPFEDLKNFSITPDTYIWKEGIPDWVKASTLPELSGIIMQQAPQHTFSQPCSFNQTFQPQEAPTFNTPPKTWLVESILVTILCCLPFGIVGIINA